MLRHENWVESACYSYDGACIVTTSVDGPARLWNATTWQEIAALRGHTSQVESARFSFDGTRIVTVSADRTARFWDTATGQEIAKITLDAAIKAVSVHGSLIAFGDSLGGIHVFEAEEFLNA